MPDCPNCRTTYPANGGGHCRGGQYPGGGTLPGCCQTFSNDETGDRHRPLGGPCLTPQQMLAKGWRLTPRGWTHHAAPTPEELARKTGMPIPADGGDRRDDSNPHPNPDTQPAVEAGKTTRRWPEHEEDINDLSMCVCGMMFADCPDLDD